ncbi:MAG: glutaredoxin family protein [Wenzhouxiangella sp.]
MPAKGLIALIAILLALVVWSLTLTSSDAVHASDFSPEHDVVLFSTEWCGHCDRARSHLQQSGVAFLEIDVESSTEANRLWREAGGRGVPLTFIGNQRLVGFSPEGFNRALENL